MAGSSSPLPIRHANMMPRNLGVGHTTMTIEDFDELLENTVPCSPGAALRHGDTQPTQVLSRPTLDRSSSPASVIEVPASSPFQAPPKRPTFGSRLAPAGTVFRPPPRQQPQPQPQPKPTNKRPAPTLEPIDLISDDEDDLAPPRGDIRPTSFKAQIAAYAYNPRSDAEFQEQKKLRQLFDVFGKQFSKELAKEALRKCDNDIEDAIVWLQTHGSGRASSNNAQSYTKASGNTSNRKLTSKGTLQPVQQSSPATPPPKPRRRLVQGLKHRSTPTPSPQKPVELSPASQASSEDPLIISLVDNDKEDAYQAERSPTPDIQSYDRVLSSINNCTLNELASMTGMKETLLEPFVNKRPFNDLAQAQRVTADKKPGARKSTKVSLGDNVVDAVMVFLEAVSAIDKVVATCETKAKTIKGVIDNWELDTFGHSRLTGPDELPPTPTSLSGSKYCRPPIPQQPNFLDGHCTMKPFQLFGLNWMSLLYNYDIGCILADEMGLGKTCQVISFISHLVEEYEAGSEGERPWPNLIVVPPSTYSNWLAEFKRFAPGISVIGYRGSQMERAEIAYEVEQQPDAYHVVLATYSQITSEADIEGMQSLDLNAAIFDEGHKMKNPETKIYRELQKIPASWKMLLTGTPVQNNLLEMTSLLNFINPRMFEGHMDHIRYIFSQKVTIRDVTNGAFLYSERVNRARTILEPFILQRRKDQVLSDMPQKIGTLIHCDMTELQKSVYDEYERRFKMEPSQRARAAATTARQNDQNNVWMQLRKAAIHPLLFRRHFTDEKVAKMGRILMDNVDQSELHQPDIKHLIEELKLSSDFELHLWCRDYQRLLGKFDYLPEDEINSGKVKKLLELVHEYEQNGDRVLVFSKFSRVIELLREVLALKDIDHRVLMGNTNVSERQSLIDEFNDNPAIPVFLLTTGAGGTGINLTAANKVIIFDQSDNPQDDIQAENRAHRLGQKRDVEVIRLLSRHTIEELINKACQKKIELANKVTGAEGQDNAKNLEQEVRKMMEDQMTPP